MKCDKGVHVGGEGTGEINNKDSRFLALVMEAW